MIGCVPLHVPGLAVSVWPCWAVPAIVGGEVVAGGVGLEPLPLCTEIVSATMPKAWAALSFPSWSVAVPTEARVASVAW